MIRPVPPTEEEVLDAATATIAQLPYLRARLDDTTIRQSLRRDWPNPPAPLIHWLWLASTDLAGAEAARAMVGSIEVLLAMLQNSDLVSGAWQRKIRKLMPPRHSVTVDYVSEFRSTLFELISAYRLVVEQTRVVIEPDGASPGCDLTVVVHAEPLLQVEVYGPQKGASQWYEEGVARPWRYLIAGEVPPSEPAAITDISIAPDAVARALANVLTDSNFKDQKAKQLAAADLPALLMIRGYGLTPHPEELVTATSPDRLAEAIGDEAWGCLPSQCSGLLLAFLGDIVVDVIRRRSPTIFIPAPERTISREVWDYLKAADMLSRDQLGRMGPG